VPPPIKSSGHHDRDDITGRVHIAVHTERLTWEKQVKQAKLIIGLGVAIASAFAGFETYVHLFARTRDLKSVAVEVTSHGTRLDKIETHQTSQDKTLDDISKDGRSTRDNVMIILGRLPDHSIPTPARRRHP